MRLAVFMALVASCDAIKLEYNDKADPLAEIKKISAAGDAAALKMEGTHSQEDLAKESQSAADQIRNIGKSAIANLSKPDDDKKSKKKSKKDDEEKPEEEEKPVHQAHHQKSIDEETQSKIDKIMADDKETKGKKDDESKESKESKEDRIKKESDDAMAS